MPVRIIAGSVAEKPFGVRPRVSAAQLPAWMAEREPGEHVPLMMLVKEWESRPAERDQMIAEEPQGDDQDDLCRIAAVVHALCERDGVGIPDWVWNHKSDVTIAWGRSFPTSGGFWDRMVQNAPPACAWHNVWFDHQFISSARQPVTKHNYKDFIIPTPTDESTQ